MSDETAQGLRLECQKCGDWYSAHISGAMLERLEDAGIEPDEVAAAIDGGLASQRLLCPSCAAVASN